VGHICQGTHAGDGQADPFSQAENRNAYRYYYFHPGADKDADFYVHASANQNADRYLDAKADQNTNAYGNSKAGKNSNANQYSDANQNAYKVAIAVK
jgi:hypothetical protein